MRLLRPWHHSAHLSPTSTLSHVSCTVSIYQNIRIVYMHSNLVKAHERSKPLPYPSCGWCFLFVFLLSIPYSLGTNDCQSLDLHWYLCPHIPYHTVNHSNVMMQRYNVLINHLYHASHQPCHEFPTLLESTSGYVRTGSEPCACGSALVRLGTQFCKTGVLEVVAGCRYRFLEDLGIQTKWQLHKLPLLPDFCLALAAAAMTSGFASCWALKVLETSCSEVCGASPSSRSVHTKSTAYHILITVCDFHRFLLGSCNSGTHQAWYVQPPGRSKMGHILSCSLSHCPCFFIFEESCHYATI